MLFWLYGFIARVALGEQLTAADRDDYRLWSAVFFLLPVGVAAIWLGSGVLDRASSLVVWLLVVLGAMLFCFIWAVCFASFLQQSRLLSVPRFGLLVFGWRGMGAYGFERTTI